jgi:hypothetical protein
MLMYVQRNECGLTKQPSAAFSYSRAMPAPRTSERAREFIDEERRTKAVEVQDGGRSFVFE